jgi:hypothetical protein
MLRDAYASLSDLIEGEDARRTHPDLPWALGVALFSALIYVAGMARSVGYWDAPERVVAALQMGFSHPPGSPFHALAGNVFSLAFGLMAPDLALNLFSALSGAAGAFYLYRLARLFQARGRPDRPLAALIALTTAFGAIVWAECLYAEVYAFHWFLWCAFLFYFARWTLRLGGRRDLLAASLLFGLGFSVQAGTALFAPFAAFLAISCRPEVLRQPRTLGWVMAMLCAGVSPYLILPIRADSYAFLGAKHSPATCMGFLSYVSGAQFQGSAFPQGWWQEMLFQRSAHFALFVIYSGAGLGCLALLAAAHRLIQWSKLATGLAAGVLTTMALGWGLKTFAPEIRGDIWTLLAAYLWPALAIGWAARRNRAWLGAMTGGAGLFVFYFGSNQTSEFQALVTPLWAFQALLLSMGFSNAGQTAASERNWLSRRLLPEGGLKLPRRWPRWLLGTTLALQLMIFPAVSLWGVQLRPFDAERHRCLETPRWQLALAKMGVRKRCWRGGLSDVQDSELNRLENELRRFTRARVLLLARWEVQTALEYYQRILKRFPGVSVIEIMREPRCYRLGGRRVTVPDSQTEALIAWRHGVEVFYLVAESGGCPESESGLTLRAMPGPAYFLDERPYRLYRAVGVRDDQPTPPAAQTPATSPPPAALAGASPCLEENVPLEEKSAGDCPEETEAAASPAN